MRKWVLWAGLALVWCGPAAAADKPVACDKCHDSGAWRPARFNHSKTDFELKGAHGIVPCARCHPKGEYAKRTDRSCRACHVDAHAGQLGQMCEKCHDEVSWRSSFGLEAHRRTNFPLTGRHALIPCVECHRDLREKTFSRVAVECLSCHEADYQAAAAKGGPDHAALGFGTVCQQCHSPLRWKPARFPAHEQCFPILGGPHSSFGCTDCHSSVTGLTPTGACMTGNTSCTGCHTGAHTQSRTDPEHHDVPGYQYKNRKCYECHHGPGGP
jgi:hypothetical protein